VRIYKITLLTNSVWCNLLLNIGLWEEKMATPTENVAVGLPPSNTVRWSPQRKAAVVEAVRNGLIGLDEAFRRYQLSAEEFLEWQQALKVHGVGGLSITRSQYYRHIHSTDSRWRARGGQGPTDRAAPRSPPLD
jgi:hypothetical protein